MFTANTVSMEPIPETELFFQHTTRWSPRPFSRRTQASSSHRRPEQTNRKQRARAWTPPTLKRYPQVRSELHPVGRVVAVFGDLRVAAVTVLSFAGALKTDHTEVLLSADFTGAIKVFINVKKY